MELRFSKLVSLGDQEAETPLAEGVLHQSRDTPYPKLELRFLKSVSLPDEKTEIPLHRVFCTKAETPIQSWNLRF